MGDDRVRAYLTNFSADKNRYETQNSYSRNKSFVQNDRGGNVENHHHQNNSDSPASEPLIKNTYEE